MILSYLRHFLPSQWTGISSDVQTSTPLESHSNGTVISSNHTKYAINTLRWSQNFGGMHGDLKVASPWGFVTSRYMVALLLMGFLLNRIQNVVSPPPRYFTLTRGFHRRSRSSFLRALYFALFPINVASTTTRLIIRLPSLYLLSRSLLLHGVILLQAADLYPGKLGGPFKQMQIWVGSFDMPQVSWTTFLSVCSALISSALTAGLEGSPQNTPSFNLFGYTFMLYMYALPVLHDSKTDNQPRPGKHAMVILLLPLLQLTMLHFLGIKRRWTRQRLIPTTICGLLNLIHFTYVYFFSSAQYPIFNFVPSLLELMLVLVIVTTVTLHVATQLLLVGQLVQPVLGHQSAWPSRDEDYSVAILKVGIACLDATNVAGWGNEVAGVGFHEPALKDGASVTLTRSGVAKVDTPSIMQNGKVVKLRGFAREIKTIHVESSGQDNGFLTGGYLGQSYMRELKRFGQSSKAFTKGLWNACLRLAHRDKNVNHPLRAASPSLNKSNHSLEQVNGEETTVYERFLRGEVESDREEEAEEDNFQAEFERSLESDDASNITTDDDDEEGSDGSSDDDPAALYADIDPLEAPVLIAHFQQTHLTRRRYMTQSQTPITWFSNSKDSITPKALSNDQDEQRWKACVVCATEDRVIICWPCRCLALCDDCRANLASRQTATKHSCPCCRRTVEGYSRIFIP